MLATSNNTILFLVEMPLHPSHGGNSRLAEENRILIEFRGIFSGCHLQVNQLKKSFTF